MMTQRVVPHIIYSRVSLRHKYGVHISDRPLCNAPLLQRSRMLLRVYIVRAKCQTLVCVVVVQSIVHRRRDFTAMLRMICALARPFCLVRTVRATSPTKSNSDACAGDHSVTTRLECSLRAFESVQKNHASFKLHPLLTSGTCPQKDMGGLTQSPSAPRRHARGQATIGLRRIRDGRICKNACGLYSLLRYWVCTFLCQMMTGTKGIMIQGGTSRKCAHRLRK